MMGSKTVNYSVALDPKRNKYSTWKAAKDRMLDEVWPALAPSFQLSPGAKIFTIGSCFARNIEQHLQRLGFKIPTLDFIVPRDEWKGPPNCFLNKYTPPAIFQEIDWARNIFLKGGTITEADSTAFLYECDEGSCIDTNLLEFIPVTRERFFQRRSQLYEMFKEIFNADCVVITLGLIEAWFDHEKAAYIQQAPTKKDFVKSGARFGFEVLSYQKCRTYIQDSIDAIRDINKDAKFLITTSPVPLGRTFTDDDVIVANTYSKSVLRAVAGDIAASNQNVDYFPSYESVVLTKNGNVWNTDLRHVSDLFIGKVITRLMETYCSAISDADRLFQRSHMNLKAEDPVAALELARQAVERSPENGELRKHLGNLLAVNGELTQAEAELQQGIRLKPGDSGMYYQLSDVLTRQGRLDEAIQAARRATDLAPDREEFRRHLARLWLKKRKFGKALLQFGVATGHRRLSRTKRRQLKKCLRFLLPRLQKLDLVGPETEVSKRAPT